MISFRVNECMRGRWYYSEKCDETYQVTISTKVSVFRMVMSCSHRLLSNQSSERRRRFLSDRCVLRMFQWKVGQQNERRTKTTC
jgi:hypothetical protein